MTSRPSFTISSGFLTPLSMPSGTICRVLLTLCFHMLAMPVSACLWRPFQPAFDAGFCIAVKPVFGPLYVHSVDSTPPSLHCRVRTAESALPSPQSRVRVCTGNSTDVSLLHNTDSSAASPRSFRRWLPRTFSCRHLFCIKRALLVSAAFIKWATTLYKIIIQENWIKTSLYDKQ